MKTKKKNPTPAIIVQLIEAAWVEIENDYVDEAADDPDKLIAKANFAKTIQGILSGSIDTPQEALTLLDDLAPFVYGPTLVSRIRRSATKSATTTLELLNELVDAFAVCAINVLGTAIVAMATKRDSAIPAAALPHKEALEPYAARLRSMLDEML